MRWSVPEGETACLVSGLCVWVVLQAALDAKRVKVTAGRIFRLSLPDGWLLLLGFGSLIGAAVCTTLIPHFTGSVVNKVGLQRQQSHMCGL